MADVAINADTVDIPSVNFAQQSSDVAAPAAGRWQLYFKSGGLYARSNSGTVVGPFSTGGDMATDPLWDAAGDLAVATGANAAAKLAIGTAYQQLRVNAGATALEYVTAGLVRIGQTIVGVGGAASVNFATIPDIFSALRLDVHGRGDAAQVGVGVCVQFNGDTGNNYDIEVLAAGGASSNGAEALAQAQAEFGVLTAANDTASKPGGATLTIPGYAGTTFHKVGYSQGGRQHAVTSGNTKVTMYAILWRSTAAITSLLVKPNPGNLVQGTTVTLYGLM